MDEDKKYEQIEAYLSGTMSAVELESFEKEVATNSALQEEVDLHRQVAETLKGEEVHQLRATIKTVNQNWKRPQVADHEKKAKVVRFPFRNILAIAATVLLLVVAYLFVVPELNYSEETLFADNFEPYKMVLNQRSSTPDMGETTKLLNQAVSAYEQKDFQTAAKLFQELQNQSPDAGAFLLYASISDLSLGNTDQAITNLEKIIAADAPLFVEQGRWYLALAYLQKGDLAKAKTQLQDISSGSFQYDAAQKILSRIQ